MLARTLALFALGLAATLYVSSSAPAQALDTDQDKAKQDQPQKKDADKGKDEKKGGFGKGFGGKGGFKGGFGGKGGFKGGFPGKGEFKKGEPKAGETKKPEDKLDAATIKARYEMYKKMYEDSQRDAASKNIEARIDRLITELQALRAEVRASKK